MKRIDQTIAFVITLPKPIKYNVRLLGNMLDYKWMTKLAVYLNKDGFEIGAYLDTEFGPESYMGEMYEEFCFCYTPRKVDAKRETAKHLKMMAEFNETKTTKRKARRTK